MNTEFQESINNLKYWISKNEAILEKKLWKDSKEIIEAEILRFKIQSITIEELDAIRKYTNNNLPESYYYFLSEVGTGQFFTGEYLPSFEIYNLAELQEYNNLFQQEVENTEEVVNDEFLIVGTDCAMGDWMGFCTTRMEENNFDIFCHEYPIDEYVETSDELKSWRTFEEWMIKVIETKGRKSL
ncbi:SMI1/KNR4 family protein [Empedobacter falsenii]|uniref:SMI1/KNR4 family protein n=1 Tax=Empedobacter falsenii TaxID=343874 RepID=UPI002576ABDA|nr:SMI1/KNR4 family protein [Empedobacter falsenii]MDM1298320.1 SMI1/KNR4 family protein [Empedobacter falsenii]MDM1318123.1 SMI1/KNR4 family protein [Empedobacter falsenii]